MYENEHDQVDAVKRFFAENGKALVVGVILGVGALVGWRYWNNHQADSARGSSLNYTLNAGPHQPDRSAANADGCGEICR